MCLPPVLPSLDPAATQGAMQAWRAWRALLLDAAADPRAATALPGRLPAALGALEAAVLALGWSQLSALVDRGDAGDAAGGGAVVGEGGAPWGGDRALRADGQAERLVMGAPREEAVAVDEGAGRDGPGDRLGGSAPELDPVVDGRGLADGLVAEIAPAPVSASLAPPAAAIPAPKPPPARLDASALLALQRSLNGGGIKGAAPVVVVAQGRSAGAEALRKAIGKVPPPTLDRGTLRNLLRQTELIVQRGDWTDLRPGERRQLLACLAARARWLQEGVAVDPAADTAARLTAVFGRMRVLSARPTDGLVHGLALAHTPTTGTWYRDAVARWDEFVGEEALPGEPGPRIDDALRRLRSAAASQDPKTARIVEELLGLGVAAADPRLLRPLTDTLVEGLPIAVKAALQRLEAAEETSDPPSGGRSLPADWPLLPRVQGKRAVLIGGDPRPEAIEGLIETFGFAVLDWPALPDRAPRAIAQAAELVRGGGYDIVFFLKRFAGHDVFQALRAATPKGTPFVVSRTYGVGSLRTALERDFG